MCKEFPLISAKIRIQMAYMGSIRTLLEAGVFHAIPVGGQSITAKEVSSKTGVDKDIVGMNAI